MVSTARIHTRRIDRLRVVAAYFAYLRCLSGTGESRPGDVDGAVQMAGAALDALYETGRSIWCALVTKVLVEALIQRNRDGDLQHAQSAMDRLANVSTDPGFVLHEITLLRLRALLARVRGDEAAYCGWVDRYRAMAVDLGFEGHIAMAAEM